LLDESAGEERMMAIGMSERTRILFVVHIERTDRDRIISARIATASEEALYLQGGWTMRPTKESLNEIPELDLTKAKILGRGLRKDRTLPLRVLREAVGKTQTEVARVAEMDQSEISRIEQRDDFKLSTLRRYARALGAKIEVTAVLRTGHRIRLDV
jgi:DNA-binding XRE family transcriptional regulator